MTTEPETLDRTFFVGDAPQSLRAEDPRFILSGYRGMS